MPTMPWEFSVEELDELEFIGEQDPDIGFVPATEFKPYANIHGDSGCVAYAEAPTSIDVQFVNGATYRYTARSIGQDKVDELRFRAQVGLGICTMIAKQRDVYHAGKRV